MKGFEFIEHTADVGIRAYGDTYKALFENAGRGVMRLIGATAGEVDRKRMVRLNAGSLEELLVNWLNELIELVFADHFLPIQFSADIDASGGDKILNARISGCYFDPDTDKIEVEVKAATYHNVKIQHSTKGYMVEVIIDV